MKKITTKKFIKILVIMAVLIVTTLMVSTVMYHYDGDYSSVKILFIISYFFCIVSSILSKKIKFAIVYLLIAMLIPQIELICITDYYANVSDVLMGRNNVGFFSSYGPLSETFFSIAIPIFVGLIIIPHLAIENN